jgi:PAS domain S-box-containing protein
MTGTRFPLWSSVHTGFSLSSLLPGFVLMSGLSLLLVLISQSHYLLFHALAELFPIIMAMIIFAVTWRAYSLSGNLSGNYFLLCLGCGYFWVGLLELLHILIAEKIIALPLGISDQQAEWFWLAGRFLEALLLLIAPVFFLRPFQRHYMVLVLLAALFFTGSAELAFAFSRHGQDLPTLFGHFCKIYSFWLICEVVIQVALYDPFAMMTRDASAYNAMPQSAVLLDRQGKIQQVNRAACQETGLEQRELLGQDCHALFHSVGLSKDSCPVCQGLTAGSPFIDFIEVQVDDERGWRKFSLSPVGTGGEKTGNKNGIVQVSTDISQQKRAEEELEATLYNLDRKVARRTQELHAKVVELEQAKDYLVANEKMASLGRLVAGFAHEINTPIGIAVGAASQLQEAANEVNRMLAAEEVDEEELEEVLEIITEGTGLTLINLRRAAELIQRFKRSSIDRTSEEIRHFRIREVIEDVLVSLHKLLKQGQVTVHVQCPEELRIISVPGMIEQVLVNLIQNSLVHGFADHSNNERSEKVTDREIHISCSTLDNFHLEYRDNGKGMSPETLEHLFEPFYTTTRGTGSDAGTGLGMYISYNLIHRHHGTLYCESQPGQGVWFAVDLPVGTMADLEQALLQAGPVSGQPF